MFLNTSWGTLFTFKKDVANKEYASVHLSFLALRPVKGYSGLNSYAALFTNRCENGKQCQNETASNQGQMEKRREKAIVSDPTSSVWVLQWMKWKWCGFQVEQMASSFWNSFEFGDKAVCRATLQLLLQKRLMLHTGGCHNIPYCKDKWGKVYWKQSISNWQHLAFFTWEDPSAKLSNAIRIAQWGLDS